MSYYYIQRDSTRIFLSDIFASKEDALKLLVVSNLHKLVADPKCKTALPLESPLKEFVEQLKTSKIGLSAKKLSEWQQSLLEGILAVPNDEIEAYYINTRIKNSCLKVVKLEIDPRITTNRCFPEDDSDSDEDSDDSDAGEDTDDSG
jgi:hypothetical protein